MTGSARQQSERWRTARVVVLAYAGSAAGGNALGPTLEVLRRALPGTTLILLWPAGVSMPEKIGSWDERIEYPTPEGARCAAKAAEHAIAELQVHAPDAAIVLSDYGYEPYAPAYLCYLAGIVYRTGSSREFGGGVLSQAIPPPHGLCDEERHLALLDAIGLEPWREPPVSGGPIERTSQWRPRCGR